MKRRTGAGASINPDHIGFHWAAIIFLFAAVVAAGVASIEGLTHAALWIVPPGLAWTLPVAVDVFLIATAIATLSLRKRGATGAAIMTMTMTFLLVGFSAVVNWLYISTSNAPGTPEATYGPWIKAAMQILLLAATEIVAALTTTRTVSDRTPLAKTKAKLNLANAELRKLRKRPGAAT